MPVVEVTNPQGINTQSSFLEFPDYYTTSMMRDRVREQFPEKHWPDEIPEVPAKGWWGEFSDALGDSYDQSIYDLGIGSAILRSDDEEAFSLLEEEYQNWKTSPDDVKNYDILSGGFVGEVFGSIAPSVGAGITTGVGASYVGTPVAGIWTGASVMASMQGTIAKGGSMRNTYIALRHQMDEEGDIDFSKAFETARRVSNTDAVLAVGEAGVSVGVPVSRMVPGFGKNLLGKAAQKGIAELSFDAAVGATGSVLSDSYAESEGLNRGDKFENALRSGLQEMIGGGIPSVLRTYSEYKRLKGEKALGEKLWEDVSNQGRPRLPYTGQPIGLLEQGATRMDSPSMGVEVPPQPSRPPTEGFDWSTQNLDRDWEFLDAPDKRPVTPEDFEAERRRQAGIDPEKHTRKMAEQLDPTQPRQTREPSDFQAGRTARIEEEPIQEKNHAQIPVIDENGVLVGVRMATRAEVEDMVKRGANPILNHNAIKQFNNGQILVKSPDGVFWATNPDGTINLDAPIDQNPMLYPDGLVLPLNEAVDPDITAEDSRVTWGEAVVAFSEELGNLRETFDLKGARVSILDKEFTEQEGAIPELARILNRELQENVRLRKALLPDEVTGTLSEEGLETILNSEVPADLDQIAKQRLTAMGANTADRTKQRYFKIEKGGKVAVQGNKFGHSVSKPHLGQRSLETQIGSRDRFDQLVSAIESRLETLKNNKIQKPVSEKDLDAFTRIENPKDQAKIDAWSESLKTGYRVRTRGKDKGKRVKLTKQDKENLQQSIVDAQQRILNRIAKDTAGIPKENLNPLPKKSEAILFEFLSDLRDPAIGPYAWENDPSNKTIEIDGVEYLREPTEFLETEEQKLQKLLIAVKQADHNIKASIHATVSAGIDEGRIDSTEAAAIALYREGMVQEGGLGADIDVNEAVSMAAQEGKYQEEIGKIDSTIAGIKTLRELWLDLVTHIIDGPEAPIDQFFTDADIDRQRRLGEEPAPQRKSTGLPPDPEETEVWIAEMREQVNHIQKEIREKVNTLLATAKPKLRSGEQVSDEISKKIKDLEGSAKDVLRGFAEPLPDTGKYEDTLDNYYEAQGEFYLAVEGFRNALVEATTSYASRVPAPKKPTVSPVTATSLHSKPFKRDLPVLNLEHFRLRAKANVMGGRSVWDEKRFGNLEEAIEQESFRLAFESDIEDVVRRVRKVRTLTWLTTNLQGRINHYRKGPDVVVDPELVSTEGLMNIETFEEVESKINALIKKAKKHMVWKENKPEGIHADLELYLDMNSIRDRQQIEQKAIDAFGGARKGRFWQKGSVAGGRYEDPNVKGGKFYASRIKFREFLDALKNLGPKIDGTLHMNVPFNIAAIPQVFKALVKLAIAFGADTGASFVDFAKAIRQKPDNEAVKVAWSDAKTGRVRTTESYSTRVIKDILKILKKRSEEHAGYKQAVAMDGRVQASWDRFLDRFHLQQYRDDGIKAPVQALLKRTFINQYLDLPDIMARIAKGSKGEPLDKRQQEDILRRLKDSENGWYLLDGLETLTSEKGLEMDKLQEELFKNMLDNKVDPVKFTRYLIAKHASERNAQIAKKNLKTGEFQDVESDPRMDDNGKAQGGGSGMGNRTAREIIKEARAEGKQEIYEKLNEAYIRPTVRNTVDMARDRGLIDEANHTKLSSFYEHYVPLRGLEDSDEIMRTLGNGVDVRGREDIQKRAMGRKSEATEVIPYVFQQWSNMLMRAERVRVMQALHNFIEANPNEDITIANPDYIRKLKEVKGLGEQVTWDQNPEWINDSDLVGYKINGKQHYMRFKNKALAHNLRNQGVSGLGAITRIAAKGTRYLSRINTQYNIGFTLPNFVRDIGLAKLTLSSMGKEDMAKELSNIRNIPGQFHHSLFRKKKGAIYDALGAAFRFDYLDKRNEKSTHIRLLKKFFTSGNEKLDAEWNAAYKEMREHGGRIQFRGLLDIETRMNDLDSLSRKIRKISDRGTTADKESTVKKHVILLKELLEDINTSVESSTRLAVYKLARDRGATPQQAAYLSRNSTINFTRRGTAGAGLNAFYMFYNAGAQGSYNILSNINHTKKGKQIAMGIAGTGFSVEMFNQMFSPEDEDGVSYYDKIPDWKKSTNLIISSPFSQKAIAVPLPYGYNALHYAGQKLFKVAKGAYLGREDVPGAQGPVSAFFDVISVFSDAFNPIGGSGNLARSITPDIADIVVDLYANKDWKGDDIRPEPSPFAPYASPESERYWSTVNPRLKYISKKINEITGGDSIVSGSVSVSPEHLEHIFGHIFGGAGATAMRVEQLVLGMFDPKLPDANDIPIARRFVAAPSSFYELEKFKNLRALSAQAVDSYKLYLENGEYEDAKEFRKQNEPLFTINGKVENASSQIRKINKAMRVISASDGLDPYDKAVQLRRLKMKKNRVMGDTHSAFVDLVLPVK
jgi:hypothetical protein